MENKTYVLANTDAWLSPPYMAPEVQDWKPDEIHVPESLNEILLTQVITQKSPLQLVDVFEASNSVHEQSLINNELEADLSQIVVQPELDVSANAKSRKDFILRKFNEGVKNFALSQSNWRGTLIDTDEVVLGHSNGVAEMHGSDQKTRFCEPIITAPGVFQKILTVKKFNDSYISAYGKHVINVSLGEYALVKFAQIYRLLASGTHFVHDLNFKLLQRVEMTEPYIQNGIIHIVRVPVGNYCKVLINNRPYLLEARPDLPYVFETPYFTFAEKNYDLSLVNVNSNYIHHGPIHIIRVPQGKLCKVWYGNEARVLMCRTEPYRFNDPQFSLKSNSLDDAKHPNSDKILESTLVDVASSTYINHGNLHIIRVPLGNYGLIYLNNEAVILDSRLEPYVFYSPWFRLVVEGTFVNQQLSYIKHNTLHILRVPRGKLATVWLGQTAVILQSRDTPYVYKTPQFKLDEASSKTKPIVFHDTNTKYFKHGPIHWALPTTGEVAIGSDGGILKIIKPNGKPFVTDSPNFAIEPTFLETTLQTHVFPSEESQRKHAKDGYELSEIPYEIVMTSDSLRIGVKILVAYTIVDPEMCLSQIKRDDIIKHIESVTDADMTRVAQRCTAQEFLRSNKNMSSTTPLPNPNHPSAPEDKTVQDFIRDQLGEDLLRYGIKLVRMNFEDAKILNKEILSELQKQAIQTASTNASVSIMSQKFHIAKTEAEQNAEVLRIKQEQENNNTVNAARANATALMMETEAKLKAAEMEAKIQVMRAEADAQAIELRAFADKKGSELQAQVLQQYPAALQAKICELTSTMLSKANVIVAPEQIGQMLASSRMAGNSDIMMIKSV